MNSQMCKPRLFFGGPLFLLFRDNVNIGDYPFDQDYICYARSKAQTRHIIDHMVTRIDAYNT